MITQASPVVGLVGRHADREALALASQCLSVKRHVEEIVSTAQPVPRTVRRRRRGPTKKDLKRRGAWPRFQGLSRLQLRG